jgi:hypothetical protein
MQIMEFEFLLTSSFLFSYFSFHNRRNGLLVCEWRPKDSTDVKLQFGRSMTVSCAEDVLKLMLRLLSDETMPLTCSLLLWDGLALDCIHIQNRHYDLLL